MKINFYNVGMQRAKSVWIHTKIDDTLKFGYDNEAVK